MMTLLCFGEVAHNKQFHMMRKITQGPVHTKQIIYLHM